MRNCSSRWKADHVKLPREVGERLSIARGESKSGGIELVIFRVFQKDLWCIKLWIEGNQEKTHRQIRRALFQERIDLLVQSYGERTDVRYRTAREYERDQRKAPCEFVKVAWLSFLIRESGIGKWRGCPGMRKD